MLFNVSAAVEIFNLIQQMCSVSLRKRREIRRKIRRKIRREIRRERGTSV